MVNYNQAYLESLVKPGSTRLSVLVDNCQKPGKSFGSTRVYQAHQAFNQTFGARVWSSVCPYSNVKEASPLSSFKYNIRKVELSKLLGNNNCSNCSLCSS